MANLRILVYPHAMEVGGSQLNAIELAASVRDRGHEVIVLGEDGELVNRVEKLGLEMIPLKKERRRPSFTTVRKLRDLIHSRGIDVVHGYEWPPGLEAAAAVFRHPEAAGVCTVMSMAIAPFIPSYLPLIVGTSALQKVTKAVRQGPVYLIEPPVDVFENAPGHPVEEFRCRYGLGLGRKGIPPGQLITVGVICRLVSELKLEGVLTAIDVVAKLARERPVQLLVVGDGYARPLVEERAVQANSNAGWQAVVLTGQLLDPRPAYSAADVMLGMGGSALRSLAFGKPLIVQGEQGFWEVLTPESAEQFLQQGWYGIGAGSGGEERLAHALRRLLDAPELRERLGTYGRDLVVNRFSLQRAAQIQEEIYRTALNPIYRAGVLYESLAAARSLGGVVLHKLRRRYQRIRGTRTHEDFNALAVNPVATNIPQVMPGLRKSA